MYRALLYDDLISEVLQLTHEHTSDDKQLKTYIHQLCLRTLDAIKKTNEKWIKDMRKKYREQKKKKKKKKKGTRMKEMKKEQKRGKNKQKERKKERHMEKRKTNQINNESQKKQKN